MSCLLYYCFMLLYAELKAQKTSVFELKQIFFCVYLTVDFSIQVLSSGSWPFQQSCTFALPSEVRLVYV